MEDRCSSSVIKSSLRADARVSPKDVQDKRKSEQADGNALRYEVDAEYILVRIDVAVAVLVLAPFVTNKENSQKLFNS